MTKALFIRKAAVLCLQVEDVNNKNRLSALFWRIILRAGALVLFIILPPWTKVNHKNKKEVPVFARAVNYG